MTMSVANEPADGYVDGSTRRSRRVERSTWAPRVGPGMVLGALGGAGIVVSMFLSWRTGDVMPSDIPFAFLFDHTTTSDGPSLLIALHPDRRDHRGGRVPAPRRRVPACSAGC